jgi:hypothetical protein
MLCPPSIVGLDGEMAPADRVDAVCTESVEIAGITLLGGAALVLAQVTVEVAV